MPTPQKPSEQKQPRDWNTYWREYKKQKYHRLTISITHDEYERVLTAARQLEMAPGAIARKAVLAYLIEHNY